MSTAKPTRGIAIILATERTIVSIEPIVALNSDRINLWKYTLRGGRFIV